MEDRVNLEDKIRLEETEEKFYYDIPIKDFKKKTAYKDSTNSYFNPKLTGQIREERTTEKLGDKLNEGDSKRRMIEEILRDSQNNFSVVDKDRPFTPPFTKLVPVSSNKTGEKALAIIERAKEEILNSDIYIIKNESVLERSTVLNPVKQSLRYDNKLLDSLDQNNKLMDKNLDLIYDHVLGCYYDPKTNMYYELKN